MRWQLALIAASLVVAAGALVWGRSVADDADEVIRLDTPGEVVDPASSNPPHEGQALPAVGLRGADDEVVPLASDGRPMVVNLWYSTCPPCARELAYFAAVHADVGDDVRFVGVNPQDDPATMRSFAADRGVDYELLRDPDGELGRALHVVQYPVTLFVAADGTVAAQTGVLDEAELRRHVGELLA